MVTSDEVGRMLARLTEARKHSVTVDHATFLLLAELRSTGFTNTELLAQIVRDYADAVYRTPLGPSPLPFEKPSDLNHREWRVLVLRIEGRATLEKIGRMWGVTRERVRQIEARALRKHPEWKA